MAKIVIDPGHGGSDPGANYNGRREKNDVLRLALAVGKKLEEKGQNVSYTRVDDTAYTPFERAMMANTANADFFLSLHRNSVRNPNTVNGVEAYVYEESGIREDVAEELLDNLEDAGFENRGILERPNLAVLRRTDMPAVLLEVGFIDNEKDNQIFDTKFDEIVDAIADAILKYAKKFPTRRPPLYRVQTGAFRNYDNAAVLVNRLQNEGYPAFVLYGDGIYRVQVGAYEILDNAIRMEQKLRANGYPTFIVSG
ncbi:MAG: N-acetylmuramoyl-L-alanine amidase [Lachnospiraceae bacterium]|nr:N-acetylmuramoyl-L-alanine amidase [Lachnospiraceae bacterium]